MASQYLPRGEDIYCASASQMFKVPVEKHGVNGDLRPKGKIAELALGYGGGVNALRAFGADRLGMSEDDMADTVHRWRGASPRIPALWRALESAAARCIVQRTHTVSNLGGIRFDLEQGILFMTLPSGRRMAYWGAAYGQSAERLRSGRVISYMGIDPRTKSGAGSRPSAVALRKTSSRPRPVTFCGIRCWPWSRRGMTSAPTSTTRC